MSKQELEAQNAELIATVNKLTGLHREEHERAEALARDLESTRKELDLMRKAQMSWYQQREEAVHALVRTINERPR